MKMVFQQNTITSFFVACLFVTALFLPVSLSLANTDTSPPVIIHSLAAPASQGSSTTSIEANISDASDIKIVLLHFRVVGTQDFGSPRQMQVGSDGSLYIYTFEPSEVVEPGLDYYITAEDSEGNMQSRGFAFDPLRLDVGPSIIVNAQPENQQAAEKKISSVWYVVGGVLAAGLVASLLGGDDGETGEPTEFTFVAR